MMTASEWFDLAWKVLTGLLAVWIFLEKKNDRTNERINQLDESFDKELREQGNRLTRIEVEVKKQITSDDLGKVYTEMRHVTDVVSAQAAQMAALASTLDAVGKQVGRMDTYLRREQ